MASPDEYRIPDYEREDLANRYSRSGGHARYEETVKKSRKRGRIGRVFAVLLLLALLVGGGWLFFTSFGITSKPFYMLLLGTDESIERNNDTSDNSLQGVYRTDTIMLARIDPANKKATLISIPRDTRITMVGYGTQKLNAAYAFGGMNAAVKAVEDIADVHIAHTALVDMDGLAGVVDTVGGIELEVPIYIDDEDAQGYLEPGWQTLNGQQALVLCRSRNAYEGYDSPDLMRAANQRMVLQAIASKVLASDAATQAQVATQLSEMVKTDLSVPQMLALMTVFKDIDTSTDIYTDVMPTKSVYEDDLWYEIVDEVSWREMMERINQGLPPRELGLNVPVEETNTEGEEYYEDEVSYEEGENY